MDRARNSMVFLIAISFTFLAFHIDEKISYAQLNNPMANNITSDIIDILSNNFETLSNQNSINQSNLIQNQEKDKNVESGFSNVIIPPYTILLEDLSIAEGQSMRVYSTNPYFIDEAHIASKLPCNEDGVPIVSISVGNDSSIRQLTQDEVFERSASGDLCDYKIKLNSKSHGIVSEIFLQNNSTDDMEFPPTSNIMIGVTKVNSLSNTTR
jgi:hypothetical protein